MSAAKVRRAAVCTLRKLANGPWWLAMSLSSKARSAARWSSARTAGRVR
ncbi:MAG TPA: hypothetical protein VHX38_14820 [Pseudonocardiaceae bacterium]|nr:hypothetical protein [Pseudonocardiaceae bacterium]